MQRAAASAVFVFSQHAGHTSKVSRLTSARSPSGGFYWSATLPSRLLLRSSLCLLHRSLSSRGQRLVAIGDVHGDLEKLRTSLEIARVMDEHENWDGGDAICVQIGDVLDRGDRELSCLRLLARLARQASGQGGTLALLYGNHEALSFEGVFSYAWEQGNAEFEEEIGRPLDSAYGSPEWRTQFAGNHPSRWAALEPAGLLAGPLFSRMKVAMIVGRSLLVHGGLTMPHLAYYGGIEEMNRVARDWMVHSNADETHTREKKASAQTPRNGAESRSEAILRSMPKCLGGGETGESSPVWVRLYSHPSDMPPRNTIAQGMIDSVLSQLDVDRMIVGHTPQRRINAALRSKAWLIDVGSSKGVNNNTAEVLEVFLESHGKEEVWILTESERIPAHKRQTIGGSFFDAF